MERVSRFQERIGTRNRARFRTFSLLLSLMTFLTLLVRTPI